MCDTADCKGTAKIDQGLLYMMNDHDNHQTMEREIAELSALERMRKRQQMMTAQVCAIST